MRSALFGMMTAAILSITGCAVPCAKRASDCADCPSIDFNEPLALVRCGSIKGVIIPSEKAQLLLRQCSKPKPQTVSGQWQPSAHDICALEHDLERFFDSNPKPEFSIRKPNQYVRQYGGFIVDGQKIIYVTAYLDTPQRKDFRHCVLGFNCDGGWSEWSVEYDVASHTLSGFSYGSYG